MSRYFYDKKEDTLKESLNKYQNLFVEYIKSIPSLTEALNQMFSSMAIPEKKINELTEYIISRSEKNINDTFENIKKKYPIIEKEEAIIISSYTCEASDSNYSPYKIINRKLNEINREEGIKQISKYLFIFLKALRKLDRYYPKQKYMYIFANKCVDLKVDPLNKKVIPYQKGVNKTFYGFTSITPEINKYYNLNGKKIEFEEGTLFTIYGNYYGYNITLFTYSLEEEIIIEPEFSFLVESAVFSNNFVNIKCKFEKYNKVLEDVIKPDGVKFLYQLDERYLTKKIELIQIFGAKFVDNNKSICKIVCQNKLYDLDYLFNISNINIKTCTLEITLFGFQNDINLSHLFSSCKIFPTSIDFSKISPSSINDLSYAFENCTNLLAVPDILKFDMSNITNISNMFEGCISLTSLPDLSKWNTTNLQNASSLFKGCKSLINLPDISKWNISNFTNISQMFDGCNSLSSLPDLSIWNTSNLIDISLLFNECSSLIQLPDLSKWNTSNVINAGYLFNKCILLSSLPDISNWNTYKMKNIEKMFSNCEKLETLPDISKWNIDNVTNMNSLFNNCILLKSLPDISKWNTSSVENMSYLFNKCCSLLVLPDISNWETSKVYTMKYMFNGCKSLNYLPNISKWNFRQVSDMSYMFCNCHSLSSFPFFSKWNVSEYCSKKNIISNCYSLSYCEGIWYSPFCINLIRSNIAIDE